MSNEEKTILKNEEETYDSITPNDNISNQKNTNSTNNIKLSSENEDINNSVFKSVISNKLRILFQQNYINCFKSYK